MKKSNYVSVPKNTKAKFHHNGDAFFFLFPWILGMALMVIGPMVLSFYFSLTNYNLLSAPRWVGFENYINLFNDTVFLNSLKLTFIYIVASIPLKLICALGVALLLNKGISGLGFYRTLYYLPSLLGGSVAISILWRNMFNKEGLFNKVLGYLGLHNLPDWINNPRFAMYTLVVLTFWQFGSSMVIFMSGLKQVPEEHYEAAAIDGAGKVRQFFYITLPHLSPLILFNLIMQTIMGLQNFTPAYIISGGTGGPLDSTMLYSLLLYLEGFAWLHMGSASAMAWLLVLLISVFILIVFGSSKYWVHYEDGGKIL